MNPLATTTDQMMPAGAFAAMMGSLLLTAFVLVPMGLSLLLLFFGTWRAHRVSRVREAREAGRADLP